MKKSVAVAFVLTFFIFSGLPIVLLNARAQMAPEPAALPPNARASNSIGGNHPAAAPQFAQAKSNEQAKSNNAPNSAKPHRKLPKMVFVVTATRMEQPLDTVGTTISVVGALWLAAEDADIRAETLGAQASSA